MTDGTSTRIDRYQLLERIGTGGMARVYRAKDLNLDRIVAVKILHDHLADDPTFKERFEREAKFIASLNHPNIVQIYDFNSVERDGYPMYYMVMPFIAGRSLRDVIEESEARSEPLSFERILSITLDIAEALAYAHANGMIHRDVKPANVLIENDGTAVLTDFGIARIVLSNRLTQEGVSTGTPAYMSPEQVSGQPGDARSDLYALGGIFFELLTGRPPFDDEGGASLMLKHLSAPVPKVSTYLEKPNPRLDAFIAKALAKNPNDRFQTARQFADEMKLAYTGRAPTSSTIKTPSVDRSATGSVYPPDGGTTSVPSIPGGRRLSPLAVIGAVIVIIAVVGLALAGRGISNPPVAPTALPPTLAATTPPLNRLMFASGFDDLDANRSHWPQDSIAGFEREITPDGFYHLRNDRPGTASTALFDPAYAYGSISISMTGTLETESNPAGAFGIVFRYQDPDHYNVFAVDGMGRFSIWVRDNGEWQELRNLPEKWTRNDAILPAGEENQLLVTILSNDITGIVNGRQVAQVRDNTFSSGNVGIYIATHTSGVTDALIDSYEVFPVSPPSMTGG